MSAHEHPSFSIAADHERTFRLRGELDMATAEKVLAATDDIGPGDLTFDLSELTFIDSTGVRALLDVATNLGRGHLILEHPTAAVLRVFEIVGLSDASTAIKIKQDDAPPV